MRVALGWVVLGVAIAVGGWRMDRLERMNIEPWSAPGLMPGVLGVLIVLFGALLAWRARHPQPTGDGAPPTPDDGAGPGNLGRAVSVLALAVGWTLVALGRGLPFLATSSVLVAAWIALLRWDEWRASGTVVRGLGTAITIAVLACTAIALLFEDVFLVRLP